MRSLPQTLSVVLALALITDSGGFHKLLESNDNFMKRFFENKLVQVLLFIVFFIITLISVEIGYSKRRENILLNGVRTEAEIKEIYWTKRGYKALHWFYDKTLNECVVDYERLDATTEGKINLGERYVVYYITEEDNQIFLDSPLIEMKDDRIIINEDFYKSDTIIANVCL